MNIFNNLYGLFFYTQPSKTIENNNQLRIIHDKNEILLIKNKLKPTKTIVKSNNNFLDDIETKKYKLKPTIENSKNTCDYLSDMISKIRLSIVQKNNY